MKRISLSSLKSLLEESPFILLDQRVSELHFRDSLSHATLFSPTKANKDLNSFEQICLKFIEKGIERSSKLYVVGGGSTTDLGGFAASVLLRGIQWVSVPSTLLGMVDASIGGKTGVDTPQGKNLIGSFHLPTEVWLCEELLKTLPQDELDSGRGEILKYLLLDEKLASLDDEDLIYACGQFKEKLVAKDLHDQGLRKQLNFGHTFGHALEINSDLSHGKAVALGIYLELSLFRPQLLPKFEKYLQRLELKLKNIRVNENDFFEALKHDKKNKNSTICFIVDGIETFFTLEELKLKVKKSAVFNNYFE